MGVLNKVKLWRDEGGRFAITCFLREGMLKNETEDEFIERQTDYLRKNHHQFSKLKEIDSTKQALKEAARSHPNGASHMIRVRNDGSLFLDLDAKTERQIRDEKEQVIRGKFLGVGLTEEEIDIVLKKKGPK